MEVTKLYIVAQADALYDKELNESGNDINEKID